MTALRVLHALTLATVALAGCAEGPPAGDGDDAPAAGGSGAPEALAVPFVTRAIDRDALRLSGIIDGARFEIGPRPENAWRVAWEVAPGIPVSVQLRWYEDTGDGGTGLTLAEYDAVLTFETNGPWEIENADYRFEDLDGDGFTNVEERCFGTDPFVAGSAPGPDDECADGPTGPVAIDVEILFVTEAPVIDGLYESAWDSAAFDGTAGELAVDALMIDVGVGPLERRPGYKWGAMHDDENLYVYVEGKAVGAPIHGDSAALWQDDNLNLFFDGDGSAGSSYDGVDDWHVFIPLLDADGNANAQRITSGPSSAGVPAGLRFQACVCTSGRHVWEVAIPIASLGIDYDGFGIEVQIDEDNDGGGRDARFGWAHPARQGEDVDFTYLNPSYMGRARLF